ncbi:MAG: hypothetical protein MHPSP_003426, partial [Paramarteilia canceri]
TCCCRCFRAPLRSNVFYFVLIKSIAIVVAISRILPPGNGRKTIVYTLSAIYSVHIIAEVIMMVVTTKVIRNREKQYWDIV